MSHRLRSEKFRYAKTRSGKIGEVAPVRSFSPAVEDYLKAIYRLQGEAGDPVTTAAVTAAIRVAASR
jgi:hypothetical protein